MLSCSRFSRFHCSNLVSCKITLFPCLAIFPFSLFPPFKSIYLYIYLTSLVFFSTQKWAERGQNSCYPPWAGLLFVVRRKASMSLASSSLSDLSFVLQRSLCPAWSQWYLWGDCVHRMGLESTANLLPCVRLFSFIECATAFKSTLTTSRMLCTISQDLSEDMLM